MWQVLADAVVVLHLAFIVFVVAGGLAVLRWPMLAWLHVPAALWGATVEFFGIVCPLTPLENWLRQKAGLGAYASGFVERYIVPVIYPAALTRELEIMLGVAVVTINVLVYAALVRRSSSETKRG